MSSVKLFSYTQVDGSTFEDLEQLVAYVARVSNPSNQHNNETAAKLVNYLIKHEHWSPLELADVTLEINTTRDISHQIVRHRSFSFQEFSQRYADPTKDMAVMFREARLQDMKNRQNSIEHDDENLELRWKHVQEDLLEQSQRAYKWAIEHNIAKEQARAVLPEGIMGTRLYMKGSLRSWVHYVGVRTDPTTQKEHREIALMCVNEIEKVFPLIRSFVREKR